MSEPSPINRIAVKGLTVIAHRCDLVLEDKRQGTAAIVKVFAKDDYVGLCISGVSKLVVE